MGGGDIESEWTLFSTSIFSATVRSCGRKIACACRGRNPPTRWTLEVRGAIKYKEELHRAMMPRGTPEAAEAVAEAKVGLGRSLGWPWRRTSGQPRRGSRKPSSASGEGSSPQDQFSYLGGGSFFFLSYLIFSGNPMCFFFQAGTLDQLETPLCA